MTADGLQELCFRLSFLFCRATRAVAVVPPIYYADLAADRGRRLVKRLFEGCGASPPAARNSVLLSWLADLVIIRHHMLLAASLVRRC